jgi:hypothetical protein
MHSPLRDRNRSEGCIAVYQSLILNPRDDGQAYDEMRAILDIAAQWRPMPDVTFLIADDVSAAIGRAERRDGIAFTSEERRLHHRVAGLFDRRAKDAPDTVMVIDRRHLSNEDAIALMQVRISERQRTLPGPAYPDPWTLIPARTGAASSGCDPVRLSRPQQPRPRLAKMSPGSGSHERPQEGRAVKPPLSEVIDTREQHLSQKFGVCRHFQLG